MTRRMIATVMAVAAAGGAFDARYADNAPVALRALQ